MTKDHEHDFYIEALATISSSSLLSKNDCLGNTNKSSDQLLWNRQQSVTFINLQPQADELVIRKSAMLSLVRLSFSMAASSKLLTWLILVYEDRSIGP